MGFAVFSPKAGLTVSDDGIFVPSQDILGADTALASAAAVLRGFSAAYESGAKGISELAVSVSASVGVRDGVNGVWVTPTMRLRNNRSDRATVTVFYTLLVTFAVQEKATTTLWTGSTSLLSPPVATAAFNLGPLALPALWLTCGLGGFALTFSDASDHWLHELRSFVGAAPISGTLVALQGEAVIADSSQHAGVAAVTGTALAIASDADGYPFLQQADVLLSGGAGEYLARWAVPADFTIASYGVFLTGFSLSNGDNDDGKISSITVTADPEPPAVDSGELQMKVHLVAKALDGTSSKVQQARVSLLALVMAPVPVAGS